MITRYHLRSLALLLGLLPVATASLAQSSTQGPDLIGVIDASGSMYGRINGVFKLHIATDAITRLAGYLPDSGRVGVVAYGHRSQDCNDVEAILPLGAYSPEQLDARLDRLQARGRAPLTMAVHAALSQIRTRDYPTTLLLVVDSADSCDRDVCAQVRAARDQGLNFTTHVLGLRLNEADSTTLRCVAEAGRGRLHNIRSLSDIDFALGQTLFTALSTTAPTVVAMPTGTDAGGGSLRTPEMITTSPSTPPTEGGTVSLSVPENLTVGESFQVDWSGPGGQWDYITLVRRGAPEGEYGRYVYTREGNPLTLQAPADSGGFELRYVDGQSQRTLVRRVVTVSR